MAHVFALRSQLRNRSAECSREKAAARPAMGLGRPVAPGSMQRRWFSTPASMADIKVFHKPSRKQFSKLTQADVDYFASILGPKGIVNALNELESHNTDWLRKYRGESTLALRPQTTDQVSKILKHCNERNLAVVPQGGNTGLVGGSVPVWDEIVINLQRMNQIRSFDKISGVVIAESGVILQGLEEYLVPQGYTVPLDLGAKGSCQIGGNASTNAGGVRLLRYGSLHGNILGLEAVLPDGRILDTLSTIRKDNTGYDLKQLFIGAEGTLGIVTAVSVLCPPKSSSVNVAFLGLESFDRVLELFVKTKQSLGEILSAFEFLDRESMDIVLSHHGQHRDPLDKQHPFYVLIETSGSNEAHDKEKLDKFLEDIIGSGIAVDGTVAAEENQAKALWFIRESISESLVKTGRVYKYDVSLPVAKMYKLVEEMRKKLEYNKNVRVVSFGHVGDANLHLNMVEPKYNEKTLKDIEPFVYEYTASVNGSISAEHGLGVMKADYIHYSKSAVAVDVMKTIKQAFDPKGIMNPYKLLPSDTPAH